MARPGSPFNRGIVEISEKRARHIRSVIFDRYLFGHLVAATLFIAVSLAAVIFLTQSLRFLELVINAGASGTTFWILTLLALPRFFEIILPIAVMGATLFVYNRMMLDSEIVIMKQAGTSPLQLARPALFLSGVTALVLWFMTMWAGPASLNNMHQLRIVVQNEYSALLFRPGVFNSVAPGLTIYIRERDQGGEMKGLMIHDSRDRTAQPVTITARSGRMVADQAGQRVVVFDGARQSTNKSTGALERLNFERYTVDLPGAAGSPSRPRWQQPHERTIFELFRPDPDNPRDVENYDSFTREAHRRFISPLLAPAYVLLALAFLLPGSMDRRGQGRRVIAVVGLIIVIQGLYLAAFNISRQHDAGLVLMYALVFLPMIGGWLALGRHADNITRMIRLVRRKPEAAT